MIDPDEEYNVFLYAGIITRMWHIKCDQLVRNWTRRQVNMKLLIEAMYEHASECPCRDE